MDFKICPNCHTQLAPIGSICPICDASLTDDVSEKVISNPQFMQENIQLNGNSQNSTTVAANKKSKTPIIIGAISAVLLIIIISIVVSVNMSSSLSAWGYHAAYCTRDLKRHLKVPSSLDIGEGVLYIGAEIDGENNDFYFIDYTAENSFGAKVRSSIVYIGDEMYNLNEEEPRVADYNLLDSYGMLEYKNALEKYKPIVDAKRALTAYSIGDEGSTFQGVTVYRSEMIPAKKIINYNNKNFK